MPFTGNEDHRINLEEAARLTKRYRESITTGSVISSFFGKSTLRQILDQPDCVGIRIYYGLSEDGKPKPVLVGAKSDQDDLFTGELAEIGLDCPPNCGRSNPLNS